MNGLTENERISFNSFVGGVSGILPFVEGGTRQVALDVRVKTNGFDGHRAALQFRQKLEAERAAGMDGMTYPAIFPYDNPGEHGYVLACEVSKQVLPTPKP